MKLLNCGVSTIVACVTLMITPPVAAQPACTPASFPVLPDLSIDSAVESSMPVAHCVVEGTIGTEIRFRLLLPENWNGKMVMGGDGGFAGTLNNQALSYSTMGGENILVSGYATVSTDVGHTPGPGGSASWAMHNLERIVNYGHLAVHRTAVNAKALVSAFYGDQLRRSYFYGCSNGGREAMMESQRYPGDFDGIIAGAPAYNWTGLIAGFLANTQAMFPDADELSEALLSAGELEIIEREVLARCDADDGLADGILNDPRNCSFDLDQLPACSGVDADSCFTRQEIDAARTVYQGPHTSSGEQLFKGFPFGGEPDTGGWTQWIAGGQQEGQRRGYPSLQAYFAVESMKYLYLNDPDFRYENYDLDDYAADTSTVGPTLSATSHDLADFRAQGGKLLLYQGWSDAAISALGTIEYYEKLLEHDAAASNDVRLFMMPGVLHCAGGNGPYSVRFLEALDNWVETGNAPSRLTAHFVEGSRPTEESRPLCAYPEVAVYDGSGNTRDEASFSCALP